MATPSGVGKITVRGVLGGGERFAFGMWYTLPEPGNRTSAQQAAENLTNGTTANFAAVLAAVRPLLSPSGAIRNVDVYYYTGGQAASDVGSSPVNLVGTGQGNLPNQIALVLTLRTATATRSGRGRIYLPATGMVLSGAGPVFQDAPVQTAVNAFNNFLAGAGPGVVVSQTQSVARDITRVDADTVPDNMTTRRQQLARVRIVPS